MERMKGEELNVRNETGKICGGREHQIAKRDEDDTEKKMVKKILFWK